MQRVQSVRNVIRDMEGAEGFHAAALGLPASFRDGERVEHAGGRPVTRRDIGAHGAVPARPDPDPGPDGKLFQVFAPSGGNP